MKREYRIVDDASSHCFPDIAKIFEEATRVRDLAVVLEM